MSRNLNVDYAERYYSPTHCVCGRRLVPLTFGHTILLTALGNRFLPWIEKDEIGDGDFAQAVFVCSMSWRWADRWLRWAPRFVQFSLGWILARRNRLEPWKDIGNLIAYFRANCLDMPDLVPNTGRGVVQSAAPLLGFIGARFIQFGMSRQELLDTPLSLLRWDMMMIGDREGTLQIRPIPEEVKASLARTACGIEDEEDRAWREKCEAQSKELQAKIQQAKKEKANG